MVFADFAVEPLINNGMIKQLTIKNYKSVVNQSFELGQFNVLIGANGCGKSNILEAIALAALSSSNKLDAELFSGRGIRVTSPALMTSAFEGIRSDQIEILVKTEKDVASLFRIRFNEDVKPARWEDVIEGETSKLLESFSSPDAEYTELLKKLFKDEGVFANIRLRLDGHTVSISHTEVNGLRSFVIYSPEESALRSFEPTGTGIIEKNGKGLFPYLKGLSQSEDGRDVLHIIREKMSVIDWFDDMDFPLDSSSHDYSIRLHDRYLEDGLTYFDQRSANEAFLYLLLYFTLIISDETPSFFAIDNIESSLNPKMSVRVLKELIALSQAYNKQIIVTTHSPYILDALDLTDEKQRLFVARRNIDGYTVLNSIERNDQTSVPLSEAWMKGYIGGLPNNF